MNNNQNTQQNKTKYKGWTVKEKLIPSLILSLVAPILVFFFGPFEIFSSNIDEFKFALMDFWPLCVVLSIACAAALFGIFMLLRGRVFDVVFGAVFGISLMQFLQGNFLSMGMSSLAGDGAEEGGVALALSVLNLAVWILVLSICITIVLMLHRFGEWIRTFAAVALIAILGSTMISFAVVSLTTDVYSAKSSFGSDQSGQVLTVKNLDTLAKDQNVIVFIVDRFDWEYYDVAQRSCPEIFDELEGFTYFADYVTLYPRTFPGALHVLTGVETDFSLSHDAYMSHAYRESEHLYAIRDAGYDLNIYIDDYYCYEDAADLSQYAQNTSGNVSYRIVKKTSLSMDMIRLSLYRYLPFALQGMVGQISTPTFDQYVEYEDMDEGVYTTDMRDVYNLMTEDAFTLRESEKGFSFIHIDGCHKATIYDSDFNELPENDPEKLAWNTQNVMIQSFKIISRYIEEMKRMGVYEDATIIITGDHANIRSDKNMPTDSYVTALLVKPAGKSEGEIQNNYAQLDVDNVLATIKEACGIGTSVPTVFEVPEGEEQVRHLHFQRSYKNESGKTVYENIIYEIKGNGKDFANWTIIEQTELGKSIYD